MIPRPTGPLFNPDSDVDIGVGGGGTVDKIVGTVFENPDEITRPLTGDSIDPAADSDLPLGAPRDPLNFDPGESGPVGGRDNSVVPRPPGGYSTVAGALIVAAAVVALGQLITVEL
jgi:hypothetical protein